MRPASFNGYIHGGRGLFCGMVFVYHIINTGLATLPPLAHPASVFALESLQAGVELFFGVSGFVIVGALARAKSFPGFMWERMTRIYPVLWASLTALVMVSLITKVPPPGDPAVMNQPWVLFANYLAPPPFFDVSLIFPATWSLGYEFTFYFLCAIYAFIPGRFAKPAAIALSVVLLIFFPRGLMFLAGVLIATGRMNIPILLRLARYPLLWLVAYLLCWRGLRAMTAGDYAGWLAPQHMEFTRWLMLEPLVLLTTVMGALSLLGIVQGYGLLARGLSTRVMQWGGTISYSFYLWHPLCLGAVKTVLHKTGAFGQLGIFSQLALAVLCLPLALVVSHISQILLEKRLTAMLRKLQKKDAKPPVTAVEHA